MQDKNIVELVAEKTGISEQQAREAVNTVANYLKEKLPGPLESQVDNLLRADVSGVADQAEGFVKDKMGGLFGGKKD